MITMSRTLSIMGMLNVEPGLTYRSHMAKRTPVSDAMLEPKTMARTW